MLSPYPPVVLIPSSRRTVRVSPFHQNAAERYIRTFKNHFIAGLSSTDPNFPLHLWDRLIPQALISLNLLRSSRINPQLSAHAQIHGAFNFERTPMAPPGFRIMVNEKPHVRGTWAPHAVPGWYIGPVLNHYRCYRVYIPSTRCERITDTIAWLPTQYHLPLPTHSDLVVAAAQDLTAAILSTDLRHLLSLPNATLHQLAAIFSHYQPLPQLPPLAVPPPPQQLLLHPEPPPDPLFDRGDDAILPNMQNIPPEPPPAYPAAFPRVPVLPLQALPEAVPNPPLPSDPKQGQLPTRTGLWPGLIQLPIKRFSFSM
jgi:hypothetical protein